MKNKSVAFKTYMFYEVCFSTYCRCHFRDSSLQNVRFASRSNINFSKCLPLLDK